MNLHSIVSNSILTVCVTYWGMRHLSAHNARDAAASATFTSL
jgi:hypothetical protein